MTKNSKRKMTLNERLYTIGDRISPSFTLQFLIEGIGNLDKNLLRQRLDDLSKKIPALRLRLKGKSWLFDGQIPKLIVHSENPPQDWNDPLFRSRLDAKAGSCSEFHLFQGKNNSLLFRVLHSAMDAKGAQLVLRSLFALMRNESINPNPAFSSDTEVLKGFNQKIPVINTDFKLSWPSFSTNQKNKYQLVCLRLDEKIEAPLAKIACWHAQKFGETSRMMIPVDLRRHKEVKNSASNLSLPIYLKVEPEQSWQEVQAELLKSLSQNKELAREKFEPLGMLLPEALLKMLVQRMIKKTQSCERYPLNGILSDNGFIDLATFSTPSFTATSVISLPVFVPLIPFCINLIQHKNQTNIAFSIPLGIDPEPLLESLQLFLSNYIESKENIEHRREIDPLDFEMARAIWSDILEIPESHISAELKFNELGGDSLKLLAMLSACAEDFELVPESAFINAVLNTGGDLNIRSLFEIMHTFRPVHP